MKTLLKWMLALLLSIMVVVTLISLFVLLAKPVTDSLANFFSGYIEREPVILTEAEEMALLDRAGEDWITPSDMPEHCSFAISGRVTMNDGAPISNAEVKIYNSGLYDRGDFRFTDTNGEFSYTEFGMETCDKDHFYISISKNGFQPYFLLAEPDQVIDISLTSIFYN